MERWKHVRGYEGLYKVSDKGRLVGVKSGRILKPQVNKTGGYLQVMLYKPGRVRPRFSVHRLVAEAFVPNPLNKPQVNHINEDKLDNRACNLEWVTASENINWGTHNERVAKTKGRTVAQLDADGN